MAEAKSRLQQELPVHHGTLCELDPSKTAEYNSDFDRFNMKVTLKLIGAQTKLNQKVEAPEI